MNNKGKQLLVKLLKEYKTSKLLLEYDQATFIRNFKAHLANCVYHITAVQKTIKRLTSDPSRIERWKQLELKVNRAMTKYDKNTVKFVRHIVGIDSIGRNTTLPTPSEKLIVDFALNNEMLDYSTKYTTPENVLWAIDDFFHIMVI